MQHSFFDVTLKFTVLQSHFHKFCDTLSTYKLCSLLAGYASYAFVFLYVFSFLYRQQVQTPTTDAVKRDKVCKEQHIDTTYDITVW